MPYVHLGKCPHLKTIPFLRFASPLTSPPVDPVVSNSCGMCCHGPRCDERFHPTTIPDPLLMVLGVGVEEKNPSMNQIWDDEKNHWCMNRSKEFSHAPTVWLGVVGTVFGDPNTERFGARKKTTSLASTVILHRYGSTKHAKNSITSSDPSSALKFTQSKMHSHEVYTQLVSDFSESHHLEGNKSLNANQHLFPGGPQVPRLPANLVNSMWCM